MWPSRTEAAMNHSLISASGNTHAKIATLAVAVSMVFMAVIATSGVGRSDGARVYGPIVKATTTTTVAGNGLNIR
jgi:hypothetical protein